MNEDQARRILRETARRAQYRTKLDPNVVLFEGGQREFATDPSRNKAAVCSRRAGKSYSIAWTLLDAAFKHTGSIVPYITLTRDSAKDILWPAVQELDRKHDLKLKFRENNGDIVLPNGSKIILRGADDQRQIEKLRGPKYPAACIDEAQGFPHYLHMLIEDVLEPALLDYNGQLLVTGTPNAACAGPFYEITEKMPGWSVHRWTMLDNPHIPHAEEWLAKKREQKGWTETSPTYMREYRGIWVRDSDGLVFRYNPRVNLLEEFERGSAHWEYVLGMDLGFNDPTAFVVIAWCATYEQAVVVHSYKESELIPSAVAVHIEKLMEKFPISKIVMDTGGFGKGYAEEMRSRFALPIVAAKKTDKVAYIELLNGDFTSGALKITEANQDLIDELNLLQWDHDLMARNKLVVDDRRFADHLCDALLYGWRECRHTASYGQKEGPSPGTKGWWEAEAKKIEEELIREIEEEQRPWWDRL